eukprot:6201115-Pleurochrysis_carterae.AAC.1
MPAQQRAVQGPPANLDALQELVGKHEHIAPLPMQEPQQLDGSVRVLQTLSHNACMTFIIETAHNHFPPEQRRAAHALKPSPKDRQGKSLTIRSAEICAVDRRQHA